MLCHAEADVPPVQPIARHLRECSPSPGTSVRASGSAAGRASSVSGPAGTTEQPPNQNPSSSTNQDIDRRFSIFLRSPDGEPRLYRRCGSITIFGRCMDPRVRSGVVRSVALRPTAPTGPPHYPNWHEALSRANVPIEAPIGPTATR